MQEEDDPGYPYLYSLQGFRFCDLLLSRGKYGQVLERAEQTLIWDTEGQWLLDIALDQLSLGRAEGKEEQAAEHFKEAKGMMERMGYGRKLKEVNKALGIRQ